ncbi:MAG: dTDP-4-dehydrorhamnose 3,5-epimerase [Rhodospirillales bacterium]|jgi:dTDP-4-dehydrorhamnose 3,5-epimerase|nr:dTDP-4-dehydrorhamnose 3,5-epimerase [Rhodospirillaceae bacterium]MDP6429416.1 dTDP-4-dehydrorhamnose 3,5-epimerase [Rhodospirillales bacterium]MDP6644075.1 dTDP-4-dehydrorhamnose 3,5-epimerase [Rhodospirillales bacterium]|tara:strand:- start:785 stop:1318 length:534 start_codon:yes stop_codon:yes gene_type:complete
MKVEKTELDGVLLIEPPTLFEDHRGEFVELYNEELYKGAGITQNFVQDDISVSSKNVLRGCHGDEITWKLVSCLVGEFYLVVVNNDHASPQYRRWQAHVLSEQNRLQVLIPPRFGNGHLVLSDRAVFHYKQTSYYRQAPQFTILWNDPEFGIKWPIQDPVLSQRDSGFGEGNIEKSQ